MMIDGGRFGRGDCECYILALGDRCVYYDLFPGSFSLTEITSSAQELAHESHEPHSPLIFTNIDTKISL